MKIGFKKFWALGAALLALTAMTPTAMAQHAGTGSAGARQVLATSDPDCLDYCVMVERRGDFATFYAAGKDGYKLVNTFQLPAASKLLSVQTLAQDLGSSTSVKHISGPGIATMDTAPPAPPGGTGSVIISTSYLTPTEYIVYTYTFYYENGVLMDVRVDEQRFSRGPRNNQQQ